MSSFADTALYFDDEPNRHAVARGPRGDYATWSRNNPNSVREWIAATGHRGDAGTIAWIPTDGPVPSCARNHRQRSAVCGRRSAVSACRPATYRAETLLTTSPDLTVLGWGLGAYRYTRYKTADRAPARLIVPAACNESLLRDQLDAICLVRDLINAPASDMLPEHLAARGVTLANEFGARCNVTVGDELLANNFPTIHAVGRASANAPRLIDADWGKRTDPHVTLIGKGVCFDSGGLDIKPSTGMRLDEKRHGRRRARARHRSLVMSQKLPVRLRVLYRPSKTRFPATHFDRATSSGRAKAPPSKSTTPTLRGGWSCATRSRSRAKATPASSSTSQR